MQVKTFRGQSYSTLLQQVKSELGPDAVILSSDCISSNGKKTFELTAALEVPAAEEEQTSNKKQETKGNENLIPDTDPGMQGEQWRQEWAEFKKSIFQMIKPQLQGPRISSRQKQALEFLEKQGVYPEVIMDLWSGLGKNSHLPTLDVLSRSVPVSSWKKQMRQGKIHCLMGPSGVGKTTTVLRLALESRNIKPGIKICLVNNDTQHAGGRLFLKHYADLSGFSFMEVKSTHDLKSLKQAQEKFDLVFMDTPGLGPHDNVQNSLWMKHMKNIQRHLVLSPVYAPEQLDTYLQKYSRDELNSLIWTKLDEACSYGTLVNASWKSALPASYLGFGKGLRHCSTSASRDNFWKLIFKKKLPQATQQEDNYF